MNYRVEHIDFGEDDKMMFLVFEEDNGVLGVFINGDARDFHSPITKQLDEVLSGKKKQLESFGNECSWLIRPDYTFIRDNYAIDEKYNEIAVNTRELRTLMDEWVQKRTEFLKNKDEKS